MTATSSALAERTTAAVSASSDDELFVVANREHGMARAAVEQSLQHAIRAGEALNEARRRVGATEWAGWLRDKFHGSTGSACVYMRVAAYQTHVSLDMTLSEARTAVTGLPPVQPLGPPPKRDAHSVAEAQALRADGMSYRAIAVVLGVSAATITHWLDPEALARKREGGRRAAARKREQREKERQQIIKRAVRKAGAATQEAWAMAERMQDVLAQASREATATDAREALSRAGTHYRKMRDEIVAALGVDG